eukprot:7276921-Prymnesium_polylepis.1
MERWRGIGDSVSQLAPDDAHATTRTQARSWRSYARWAKRYRPEPRRYTVSAVSRCICAVS